MPKRQFDQLQELLAIQERMNRLFEDALRPRAALEDDSMAVWSPAVDIFETENEIVLKAELAEVREEDIQVNVENDRLTIRGERKLPDELKREQFHRIERVYGTFARHFTLPHNIDQEKIRADYKQGVLTIRMPKQDEVEPRHIQVKIG